MLSPQTSNPSYRHEKYMDEVANNLWLGQYEAVLDDKKSILQRHKITHIVSIGRYEASWTTRKEPRHLLLDLNDSPFVFVTDHFARVFAFMDEALNQGNGVLVHCEQGKSRSSAIVIGYLMKKSQKQYPETLNKILAHCKKAMPNIGFQIQLRNFGKNRWNTSIKYSDKIDIKKELANALKNLTWQVNKLQADINKKEHLFVTITDPQITSDDEKQQGIHNNHNPNHNHNHNSNNHNHNHNYSPTHSDNKKETPWKRTAVIGLDEQDLNIFRKEWVLLVFLCHQFQLYEIAVHKDTITILYILGEMYFLDLLQTFKEVVEPTNPALIMDYDDPSKSIGAALQIYSKKEREHTKS